MKICFLINYKVFVGSFPSCSYKKLTKEKRLIWDGASEFPAKSDSSISEKIFDLSLPTNSRNHLYHNHNHCRHHNRSHFCHYQSVDSECHLPQCASRWFSFCETYVNHIFVFATQQQITSSTKESMQVIQFVLISCLTLKLDKSLDKEFSENLKFPPFRIATWKRKMELK